MKKIENKKSIKRPELLAPAGNFTMLRSAVNAGVDAVYFGLQNLSMRAKANNFQLSDLPEIVEICKNHNVQSHLTLNTIIYEYELPQLDLIISTAKDCGIDLIICWDFSVIQKCKAYEMPFCISTQASVSNSEAALFFQSLGAKRIVLARECTLDKIIEIKQKTKVEIETFIHGAMCVALSGRCFMSHEVFDKSANRGECIQPCRREYEIIDKDEKFSFVLGEDYVMSPKDLCTIDFIDKLIEADIDAFKIEGRKRSPEYITKVVSIYRNAIDLYFDNKLDDEVKTTFKTELEKVYNRGFSSGFYFGDPGSESYAKTYGSIATTRKVYIGRVLNYYKRKKIAYVKIEADKIKLGDSVYISGNTTGIVEINISNMIREDLEVTSAVKGENVTFECEPLIRENDKVYKIINADI